MERGVVYSVSISPLHTLIKEKKHRILLLKGLGVKGDAHMGERIKHRSRVAKDPTQPNLRQVHLIHTELHEELRERGFDIDAGQMGENITTSGIDILNLPKDSILKIGTEAQIRITGLRNPCNQLESLQTGLMAAVLDKNGNGSLIRKAGVMAVVEEGGNIKVGDIIEVVLPEKPYYKLEKV